MRPHLPLRVLFALALLLCLAQLVSAAQLWPSLKTYDRIPASQADATWLGAHYDWIDSAKPPIDTWFSANPNIGIDQYFHWLIINTFGDYDASSTPSLDAKWYDWCVTNNVDWESGFFHLGIQDTYIPQSLSTYGQQEDAKLRYVFHNSQPTSASGANTYRDQAWNGTASLTLATAGDVVYFGRLDRFSEINLEFSTAASSDWQGAWEYWNGARWTALSLASDTSNDCQANGRISFVPPTTAQWKRTKVNGLPTFWGASGVYFVRLRAATAGSRGPVISRAQGRHYWVHNGTSGNTVPAWDPMNDRDGDGYAESAVNPSATAKFKYEARLPHFWAWCQYVLNVNNPTIRQKYPDFTLEVLNSLASATHRYKGAQLDDLSNTNLQTSAASGRILEYPGATKDQLEANWWSDLELMLTYGQQVLNAGGYWLGANVGWGGRDSVCAHLDYMMREDSTGAGGCNRPSTTGYWGNWEEYIWPATTSISKWGDAGRTMLWQWQLNMYYRMGESSKGVNLTNGSTAVTGVGTLWTKTVTPGSVLTASISGVERYGEVAAVNSDTSLTLKSAWSGPTVSGQSCYVLLARDKYLGLAAFLAFQNPATDHFSTWYGYYYNSSKAPYFNWIPAATVDYGTPTGVVPSGRSPRGNRGAYLYQTGTDPSVPTKSYLVYARDYTKALVLFRPITGGGTYFEDSAVTVTLPEAMQPVDYFGNLRPAVTQVTLRNAEGIILMKPSTTSGTPNVSVVLSASVPDLASVPPGQVITYTITCRNTGTAADSNVVVTDTLPAGLVYVANTTKLNGVTVSPDPVSGNTIRVTVGMLAAGQTATITLQARVQ